MCCSKFFIYFVVYFFKYSVADGSNVAEDILEEEYGRIIHASVLFRHGDRTITDTYPNDPHPPSIWTEGIGELTKTGKLQEYELGKWLRKRYGNPLNISDYEANEIRMDSSDANRTVMSAELVLAGFYYSNERDRWNNDGLRWQPVPVHSISESVDNILALSAPCDRYDWELDQLTYTDDVMNFQDTYYDLLPYIANHSGIELSYNKPLDVAYKLSVLYGILFVEDLKNLTLPKWTEKVYPEPLQSISVFSFVYGAHTDEMKLLKSGPLLGRMVQDMVAKRNHALSEKINFYSAHDTTLVPFLNTLGVFNYILVPYSATVLVELRLKNKQYIVTVSYRNSSTHPPYLLEVPGCGHKCTLEKFVEITEIMIPDDWDDECGLKFDWPLALFYIVPPVFFVIVFFVVKSKINKVPNIFYKNKRKPARKEYQEIDGSQIS